MMRTVAALAALVVTFAAPRLGRGGETIQDPERPAVDDSDTSSEAPSPSNDEDEDNREEESEGEGAQGDAEASEVIADPENPLVSESDEAQSSEDASSESSGDEGGGGARSASFRAGYGTGLWVDTRWQDDREDIVEWRNRANLTLESTLSPRWSARISAEFYHWMGGKQNPDETDLLINAARSRAAAEFRLGESYVLYQSDRFALRAGNLVTSWGSTDLIRPGDVVNPVDATEFTGPAGGRGGRLPQPAVELSYVRPKWSATGVVVPFYLPHRFAVFGRDSGLATGGRALLGSTAPVIERFRSLIDRSQYEELQPLLVSPTVPDEKPKNVSLGLRLTGTRWNTDFGFGYFWGWDRTPSFEVDPAVRELGRVALQDPRFLQTLNVPAFLRRNPEAGDLLAEISGRAQSGEELVATRYKRRQTFLVDAARYLGPVGVRADLAFQPERTFVTRAFRSVRRPTVFAALGTSYERLTGDRPLAITVEGFWFEPLEPASAPSRWFVSERELGRGGAPLVMFDDPYRGVAGAFDWTMPWASLELRLGGLVELDRGGAVFDAALARQWEPWLRTSLGARIYEGPDLAEEVSLGGLYDPNDQVGLTVEGSF